MNRDLWAIGDFRLDLGRQELRLGNEPVELQARVFDLLAFLVRHAGEVVPRARLFDEVWGGVHVSDGALSTAIYDLRRAVGDQDRSEPWLTTLRGRGFRFDAPVRRLVQSAESPTVQGPPYVGRSELLHQLTERLEQARAGQGQLVLLDGEAGMGKTRTAMELVARAEGFEVARGWCDPRRAAPAFWPWTQVLRELPSMELAEGLQEALGIREGISPLTELPSEDLLLGSRVDVLDGLAGYLRNATRGAPLLAILEDFHDGDGPSHAALEFVARRMVDWPAMVLVTYRPDQISNLGESLGGIAALPHVSQYELPPLDASQVLALVHHVLGQAPAQWISQQIFERSGGNPFFAYSLAREVDPVTGLREDLPRGVRAVLARVLDRLSPGTRRVVGAAATAGVEFDTRTVEAIVADPVPETWIEEAKRASVIEPVLGGGGLRFSFRHGLLRDASVAELEFAERAHLHQKMARLLIARGASPTGRQLTEIAHHLSEALPVAKDGTEAYRYAMAAAEEALRSGAWESCDEHTAAALRILRASSEAAGRRDALARTLALRCVALNSRGGRDEEMGELLADADALEDEMPELRPIFAGLRFVHEGNLGRYGAAWRGVEELEASSGGPHGLARLWTGTLDALTGNFEAARDLVPDEPLVDGSFQQFARRVGQDPLVVGLGTTSLACFALGEEDRAMRRIERALATAREIRDPYSEGMASFLACMLHDLRGDARRLAEAAAPIDPLCAQHGVARFLGSGFMFGSWAAELLGEPEVPMSSLAQVVAPRFKRPEGGGFRGYVQNFVARVFERAEMLDEAEHHAMEAREWSNVHGETWILAETWRLQGRLSQKGGRSSEARDQWIEARDLAREQGSPVFELRALLDLSIFSEDGAAREEAVHLVENTPELPRLDRAAANSGLRAR